jgi:MFS family permease
MKTEVAPPVAIERRNVILLGADMALFMTALGLLAPLTLVPLFVSKLTDNPLAIGGLTAAFQLGWLPQIFSAAYYERSHQKKSWLVVFGLIERLPALGLTLTALAVPYLSAPAALALVYLWRFGQSFAGGPAATAWLDMVGRSVPARRRGRFMSWSTTLGHLLGAAAAALAVPLLDRLGFPLGFAACFGIGFLLLLIGWLPLMAVADPPGPPPRRSRSLRQDLAELPRIVAADPPFGRLLLGLSLGAFGMMASGFLAVYGVAELGASDELAGWYTASLLIGQVAANLAFGWLADRRGYSLVAQASAAASLALAALAVFVRDPHWLLISFFLLGAWQAGGMLARLAGPMDFAPAERRPTYVALASGVSSLALAAAPLAAGQVVSVLGYGWLFSLCMLFSVLSMAALGVKHPARSPGHA